MTDKLKPCPFCGGNARLICVIKKFGRPVGWNVECFSFMGKGCGAKIHRRRRKEAMEAWNRRVDLIANGVTVNEWRPASEPPKEVE